MIATTLVAQTSPTSRPRGGFNIGTAPVDYPVPHNAPTPDQIAQVIGRILTYLETANPARAIDRETRQEITTWPPPTTNVVHDRGENNAFPLVAYEWGVTYAAMIHAGQVTADPRYHQFISDRYELIHKLLPIARAQYEANPRGRGLALRSVIAPRSLDDSGAMCASMIKARRASVGPDMMPIINTYIDYISTRQQRLSDGTLARRDPQPEVLWLDDLYMSVPALAQMGILTGERKYFDDGVKQVLQFSSRMFNRNKGLFMHGWAANGPEHPEFYWARANGWAIMAMVELLEVLPEDHPQRGAVLEILRAHIKGLGSCQCGEGRWHNVIDRNDSYLETSATAMFVYSIARAINRGWVSGVSYGPVALLGWNAVANKINARGQVEDVCVGTSLAFDPAYYFYRPKSVYALHGYGPAILAGAEMMQLLKSGKFTIQPGVNQFSPRDSQR
jgi:rhamnogalacturonyl hydrolase YesR